MKPLLLTFKLTYINYIKTIAPKFAQAFIRNEMIKLKYLSGRFIIRLEAPRTIIISML